MKDSQQRYEDELLQLREKLQSVPDHHGDTCQSESQIDEVPSGCDSLENGEHESTDRQTFKSSGQMETSEHRLHEILNRELSMFSERLCSSRTVDVSNEQETNERHEVAGGFEEGSDEKSADNGETSNKESADCSSNVDSSSMTQNEDLTKEVDNLRRKLTDGLIPLLSSNDGKFFDS